MHFIENRNYKRYSLFTLIGIMLILSVIKLNESPMSQLKLDNLGFYMYLPAKYNLNDLALRDFDKVKVLIDKYSLTPSYYQFTPIDNGNVVIRFFRGLSYLYTPGYLAANVWAKYGGYPMDGFSYPYAVSIWLNGILFFLIGIVLARKILLRFFNEVVTSLTLLVFYFGTNLFFMMALGNDTPHLYLLTLAMALIWLTIKWHDKPSPWVAAMLGLIIGVIIASRPSELIMVFIPLLWGVTSKETLKEKLSLVLKHKFHLLLLIVLAALPIVPQLLYWKEVTGNWLFFPYNDPGSQLVLSEPKFLSTLFGFRKGWFLYSPLCLLAFIGLYLSYKSNKLYTFSFVVYLALNIYLISCFSSLYSYGWRAFIQSYAALLLPLALVIASLGRIRNLYKFSAIGVIILLMALNIFQSWQFSIGLLNGYRMTKQYYFAVFLKTQFPKDTQKLLLPERVFAGFESIKDESKFFSRVIKFLDFETPKQVKSKLLDSTQAFSGRYSIRLDTFQFINEFKGTYSQLTSKPYVYIRTSVRFFPLDSVSKCDFALVTHFSKNGQPHKYVALGLLKSGQKVKMNEWNFIYLDYMSPEVIDEEDPFKTYLWYRGTGAMLFDDFRVEVFEPKEVQQ